MIRKQKGLLAFLVQLGIRDACVVNGHELFFQDRFCHSDFFEGDGAFVEEAFGNLPVYNLIDQLADALLGVFGE